MASIMNIVVISAISQIAWITIASAQSLSRTEKERLSIIQNIKDLKALIPPAHLEFYKTEIFPKIIEHVQLIHSKLGKEQYEISEKNLFHVHIYFKDDFNNPRVIEKLKSRKKDITYLYHAKEFLNDETKRSIVINNRGKFQVNDGRTDCEGQEIESLYFVDSIDEFENIVQLAKGFLDKNSIMYYQGFYFAISNMNYESKLEN